MSFLDTLAFYFAYPFIRYALIVGVLIALCSSLLGAVSYTHLTLPTICSV